MRRKFRIMNVIGLLFFVFLWSLIIHDNAPLIEAIRSGGSFHLRFKQWIMLAFTVWITMKVASSFFRDIRRDLIYWKSCTTREDYRITCQKNEVLTLGPIVGRGGVLFSLRAELPENFAEETVELEVRRRDATGTQTKPLSLILSPTLVENEYESEIRAKEWYTVIEIRHVSNLPRPVEILVTVEAAGRGQQVVLPKDFERVAIS